MPSPKSSRDKVRQHRERLRLQGLRPVQIWVPDTRVSAFQVESHRQSLLVGVSADEAADQAFVDAVADWHAE